ncbi:CopD family protein [Mycolicibacterium smegmatis]|uniref:CopD family protein n=1 Tax=Mycolicibacterium smegmatis TaxID=1772 RepID=UPI0003249D8F|nr:hypothetical protein [Mycolicibacterium smegmatis]
MPSFVDIGIEVMQCLAISVPVGIGMTVSVLALPEETGGVVAKRVRALALPAAVLVFLAALPAFPAADTGAARVEAVGLVVTGLGSAALWTWASRPLAGGVAAIAALTGFVPNVPVTFTLNDVAHDLLTAVHVLGMQVWTGGLIVLALAGVLGRIGGPPPDALRATEDWTRIWERFTLVAMCAVGAMIVSGTWLAWTHVGTVGQFFTTSYGRHLFVSSSSSSRSCWPAPTTCGCSCRRSPRPEGWVITAGRSGWRSSTSLRWCSARWHWRSRSW